MGPGFYECLGPWRQGSQGRALAVGIRLEDRQLEQAQQIVFGIPGGAQPATRQTCGDQTELVALLLEPALLGDLGAHVHRQQTGPPRHGKQGPVRGGGPRPLHCGKAAQSLEGSLARKLPDQEREDIEHRLPHHGLVPPEAVPSPAKAAHPFGPHPARPRPRAPPPRPLSSKRLRIRLPRGLPSC